jgi:hypothetical protein
VYLYNINKNLHDLLKFDKNTCLISNLVLQCWHRRFFYDDLWIIFKYYEYYAKKRVHPMHIEWRKNVRKEKKTPLGRPKRG